MKTPLIVALGALATLAAAPALAAPLDGYMRLDGARGDAAAPGHKNWIQVTGISQLPAGCRGDETGGALTVRVTGRPYMTRFNSIGIVRNPEARLEIFDGAGEPIVMLLQGVELSTTYAGAMPRAIKVGLTSLEAPITDGSDLMTLNFSRVTWMRPGCEARDVAAR